jgi:hypothetical protein
MARKTGFKNGGKKNQEKQMVFYHRAKRIGNQFVTQRSIAEHYTTSSYDDAKMEKKADFHNIRNDHRVQDGVNIGGNKTKQYGFYKTLWDFENTAEANKFSHDARLHKIDHNDIVIELSSSNDSDCDKTSDLSESLSGDSFDNLEIQS